MNTDTTLLTRISQMIATTQDTTTLLATIVAKLQPVFDFYDVGLFVIHEAENYHVDLAVETPAISPSEGTYLLHAHSPHRIPHQNSVVDWMVQQIEAAHQPVLSDFQDLMVRFPDYPQWEAMRGMGYYACLTTTLRVRGEVTGVFCLNARQSNHFSTEQFPLFQRIADQIAITLSHILAREEVMAQKQRVEQLLTISQAITEINDRQQLLKIIYERIRPIFPYDEYGLFVLTEDGQHHYELIDAETMDFEPAQVAIEQRYGAHHRYRHPGSAIEEMIQQGPGLFQVDSFLDKHPQAPIMYASGLRQLIGGPLLYGGEAFGMLCFTSRQEDFYNELHLPLFTAIAEQFSVAVSNVLAAEAVLAEKTRVEKLYTLSSVLATIQHREQLHTAFEQIKAVLPFENAGLFVLTPDGEQHYELLDSETLGGDAVQTRLEARFGKHARYPHGGSPVEWLMQAGGVSMNDFATLSKRFADYPQTAIMRASGLRQLIAAPLKRGDHIFGLLNLNSQQLDQYSEQDVPLFAAIAEQMSTVVSNILATEEIQRQEREKTLQLALIHALNQSEPWADKLLNVVRLLQSHLDTQLVIFALQPDATTQFCHVFERLTSDEYRSLDYDGFLGFTGLSEPTYRSHRDEGSVLVRSTGDAFVRATRQNKVLGAVVDRFRVQSSLSVPLSLGTKGYFKLSLFSRNPTAYHESDAALMQTLKPTLELALEKLLAFDLIARLNEQLSQEKAYLQEEVNTAYNVTTLIGDTPVMQAVFTRIGQVAKSETTVLILGETGTGKELIARALHDVSPRRDKPLVKLNCAALPESLVESELFGHEKGAFTGAMKRRVGKFELAHEGTIFLDEIGELSLAMQAKLLRVLQEKEVEPLGSDRPVKTNFRLIAATNRHLEKAVQEGQFRLDLYYRLTAFPIVVPPLRQRTGDIPRLVDHYGRQYARRLGYAYQGFTEPAWQQLLTHAWPGNVRELQNVVEQAVLTGQNQVLEVRTQLAGLVSSTAPTAFPNSGATQPPMSALAPARPVSSGKSIRDQQRELERQTIRAVLVEVNWRVRGAGGAAERLAMKPTTLESRMKKLGITRR